MVDLSGVDMSGLNEILYGLVSLSIYMIVGLGIVAAILRFVPIPKGLKGFLFSLSGLAVFCLWVKITFM